DGRAATGLVVDHDRLAELALQRLRQQAREDVVRRARRVGHDDPNWLTRKTLGLRRRRQCKRRDGDDKRKFSNRGWDHAQGAPWRILANFKARRSTSMPPTQWPVRAH